jgi:hypothetical protein
MPENAAYMAAAITRPRIREADLLFFWHVNRAGMLNASMRSLLVDGRIWYGGESGLMVFRVPSTDPYVAHSIIVCLLPLVTAKHASCS